MRREVNTDQVATLLIAKELFLPLHKLKLGLGNSSRTKCDMFTAGGFLVVKTNTGDFKAKADGELWPSVTLSMMRIKQLAKIYKSSDLPVRFEGIDGGIKIDTTSFKLE